MNWQAVSTQCILKDEWIDLRADRCRTPSGRLVAPYYVLTYPDWVNVVALDKQGQLVLVRQYRHAVATVTTELPGGACDVEDYALESAARRELLEETGFAGGDWTHIGSLFPNPATHTNRMHVYLAINVARAAEQKLEPGEEGLNVVTVPLAMALNDIKTGAICHALHVSAILLTVATAKLL